MEIRSIDLRHRGQERVICAWLVGDTIVDPGPESCLDALLEGLGEVEPRTLALTHVHLDHAGVSGSLVRRWPELRVLVHERGARHMADPGKLLASAARLYGAENMARLWGEVLPVPLANLQTLTGGERIGSLEVAYTPGHASHHVSYLHEGTAFAGDVAGVRIPPSSYVLAPTPPPDIELGLWHDSIARLRAWRPERLALTHFGAFEDVDAHLDRVGEELERWSARAQALDQTGFCAEQRDWIAARTPPDVAACFELAAPPDQGWLGLDRYHSRA